MKACQLLALLSLLFAPAEAFLTPAVPKSSSRLLMAAEKVEVCGFKDCRRAGGGKRLENLVKKVLEDNGLETTSVEGCDCQGECGYGPNVVVDGKLINGVRGRAAVLQALGIEEDAGAVPEPVEAVAAAE